MKSSETGVSIDAKVKPLSCEEVRARLEEIRQLGWFAPNWEDAN
jgi:hypothetical protein